MNNKNMLISGLSGATLLMASMAFAGGPVSVPSPYHQEGKLGLTAEAGGMFFDTNRHLKNRAIPEIGLSYDLSHNFSAEAIFSYFKANSRVKNQPRTRGYYVSFNGLYYFNADHAFQPYLTAGIGVFDLNPNGLVSLPNAPDGTETRTAANINAGVGVMYFMSHRFALRAEVKDVHTFNRGRNDVLVSGGFTYYFGNVLPQSATMISYHHPCFSYDATTIHFANNSSSLNSNSINRLNKVAGCLNAHPNYNASIKGYASSIGTSQYNLKLSQKRAGVTKHYLQKKGVHGKRLHAKGYGDKYPVASNKTAAGQAKNRRVVINLRKG